MKKLTHLTRISVLLAVFFALDKVLAFGKSILFNKIVGLEGMGIFGAANNIPDYLSALLSGGALGMAFIPVLSEYLDRKGCSDAWALFSHIVNLAFAVTGIVAIAIMVFSEPLVRTIIVPGFSTDDQRMVASLMRLDLIAILIFSISGLVMSGLQANQHFLLPALAPIFYNLGQIFGVVFLSPEVGINLGGIQLPSLDLGLYGMVYGVIMGAGLHLLIQIPGLVRYKFHWQPGFGIQSDGVRRVLILLGPRILTMACIQGYFLSRDNLASAFGTVGVGALNLAWTIEQVPETIVGTAIAVALLPSLAEFINRGEKEQFRNTVNKALRVMLAICLPAAMLLALGTRALAAAIFDYDAVQLDLLEVCAQAFLIGLVGEAWLEVAVRAFYANQETRIPFIAAISQLFFFIAASLIFRPAIGLVAIPAAAAVTITLQALLLLFLLDRKFPGIINVRSTLPRVVLATTAAGVVTWVLSGYLQLSPLFSTLVGMTAGGFITIPFIWPELRTLIRL